MDDRERQHRSAANAVGGSTARACDGCLRRRARWYCGADDAFLCQACDSSVHSANSLAGRHQRLLLHTASSPPPPPPSPPPISWRKRKARTPRSYQLQPKPVKPEPLVPDLENEEEDLDAQLMYCVPVLSTEMDHQLLGYGLGYDGRWNEVEHREMWGKRRRGKRSESDEIQREEKNKTVFKEDSVRSEEAECREAAQDEGPVREAHNPVDRSGGSPVPVPVDHEAYVKPQGISYAVWKLIT